MATEVPKEVTWRQKAKIVENNIDIDSQASRLQQDVGVRVVLSMGHKVLFCDQAGTSSRSEGRPGKGVLLTCQPNAKMVAGRQSKVQAGEKLHRIWLPVEGLPGLSSLLVNDLHLELL